MRKLTNKEVNEYMDRFTNEVIRNILIKNHNSGQHKYDKKIHCPICILESKKESKHEQRTN